MSKATESITRFVRYVTLGELAPRAKVIVPNARNIDFSISGREIYSYGRHFPLARYIPARGNVSAMWLVNGDTWSRGWSATPGHQSDTRTAIADAIADAAKVGKNVTTLIVPFSALDGASIDRDSIRPIHVREDRREVFRHTAKANAAVFAPALPTREALAAARSDGERERDGAIKGSRELGTIALVVTRVSDDTGNVETYTRHAKVSRATVYRGYDYGHRVNAYVDYDPPKVTTWLDGNDDVTVSAPGDDGMVTLTWQSTRHWLGDSLFTAASTITTAVPCPSHVATDVAPTWCETCGSSLARAGRLVTQRTTRRRYLSSFDYNEPGALYFLAALPSTSRARTVDMALDDLAPAAVHAAYARGIDVQRQGDIFAIATRYSDADIAAMAVRRCRLFAHTHGGHAVRWRPGELGYAIPPTARELERAKVMRAKLYREYMRETRAGLKVPTTPAGFKRDRRAKRAEILAEMARHTVRVELGEHGVCSCDHHKYTNERDVTCQKCMRPVYYRGYTFANAQRGIERCREMLRAWHADSERVSKRMPGYASNAPYSAKHGKCYRRAVQAWQHACDDTAQRMRRVPVSSGDIARTLAIYGTAHTATEVAVTRNGATYVRGIMRHVPGIDGNGARQRDHRPVKLVDGTVWYLAVRNTVPRI